MGIRELRKLASEKGVKGYSRMNKAELEVALGVSASDLPAPKVPTGQSIGEVNGQTISVSSTDTDESIGVMLGKFNKSDARKVRRLLNMAGYRRFAAVPRCVCHDSVAKAA